MSLIFAVKLFMRVTITPYLHVVSVLQVTGALFCCVWIGRRVSIVTKSSDVGDSFGVKTCTSDFDRSGNHIPPNIDPTRVFVIVNYVDILSFFFCFFFWVHVHVNICVVNVAWDVHIQRTVHPSPQYQWKMQHQPLFQSSLCLVGEAFSSKIQLLHIGSDSFENTSLISHCAVVHEPAAHISC